MEPRENLTLEPTQIDACVIIPEPHNLSWVTLQKLVTDSIKIGRKRLVLMDEMGYMPLITINL